jgi:hypothetical protein
LPRGRALHDGADAEGDPRRPCKLETAVNALPRPRTNAHEAFCAAV